MPVPHCWGSQRPPQPTLIISQSTTGNAANGFNPVPNRKVCTRCFADHTNRANGSPSIKFLSVPRQGDTHVTAAGFQLSWIFSYPICGIRLPIGFDSNSWWVFGHIPPPFLRLLASSPTLRPSRYKCHLLTVNRCRASHVSLNRRCNAPPLSVLLTRHTPLSGFPVHFHPARFQSRWCTHKPTSTSIARLSVTAHHNLPHSILKGCRYRLKLSSDLPSLR